MEEVAAKVEEETVETNVDAVKEDNATIANESRSPESVSAVSVVSNRAASTKKKPVISSNLIKPTASSSLRVSGTTPVTIRRNSTGGVTENLAGTSKVLPKQVSTTASRTDPVRRSLPELRKSSVSSLSAKTVSKPSLSESKKSVPVSPGSRSLTKSTGFSLSKPESSARPAMSVSVSSKRAPSSSVDSSGSRTSSGRLHSTLTSGRTVSKVSSPSAGSSPSVSSSIRSKSFSSPLDRTSNFSGRKKTSTPESRDSRLIILPKVEVKAGDDMRLDLRGHRIRSLTSGGLHLSPNLEFVYLRDNLLSTLEGIEILNRVKVLDLSFNDFKGPGFEPLENCKMLQQLYLAGNQITSLASLPQLPNLEFLSVAQNKLKSLAMASQPRLQVLAASKNKITTLKDFPYLPVLEHLRVEENPLLKISHLEAASILLVGPTLKKFNDRDLSREEVAIAKRYPPQTALCLREGWEFCKSDLAAESTFRFLVERWKDTLPSGYLIKEAHVDRPSEEAPCQCHFGLFQESPTATDQELALKFQWSVADRSLSNFVPILNATKEVYWPKREDIGKILKIECTPVMAETEYPSIFAISSPVQRGKGIPKVVSLELNGELVEGNIIKGQAVVAWCGGTPGKCITSWLRRKWNGSPVVIDGAEDEEYMLSLDDVGSSMVFMYTPVTEGGARGEPQYKYTEFVKAAPPSVSNVRITGDAVEGCVLKGVGDYFGGKEGPSKFEWLRKNKETGELSLISAGTSEYTLTQEDVGTHVTFVYIPANFEGLEGEPVSTSSSVVKPAPPKVTDAKIVGDLRENSKVTVTGTVTGGTEGSSRVQWFKSSCSILEGDNSLEELSTSKVAKSFRIPLGAVGYYIVAKYTPMTPDGECGEPVYVLSERAVETLPPSLNFLSITGDNIEGGILTASYGYIGGHEGKSKYEWHYHKAENDLPGALIPEASGLLQYTITKEAIGKFISFQCIPVRDDGIVGEPRSCMSQERVRPGNPSTVSLHTEHLLVFFGQNKSIATLAGSYAKFMIPSIFAYGLLQCFNRFLQAQNNVFPVVFCSGVTTSLHVLLCWVLVFKSGLGFQGAALANSISYWLNVVLLFCYVKFSPSCSLTWTGFSKEALRDILPFLRLAVPSALMVCLEMWSFELLVLLSGLLPNPVLETSVLSICLNTSGTMWMIPFGLSGAASTRISNELGAGNPKVAKLAVRVVICIAVAESIVIGSVLILIRNIWGLAYSSELEVVSYVASMMPILALGNFLDSLQCVLSGVARGCGWQKIGAIINLGSYYLVGVPSGLLLAFHFHVGGRGLWLGIICALVVQVFGLGLVTIFTNWDEEAKKATNRIESSSSVKDFAVDDRSVVVF